MQHSRRCRAVVLPRRCSLLVGVGPSLGWVWVRWWVGLLWRGFIPSIQAALVELNILFRAVMRFSSGLPFCSSGDGLFVGLALFAGLRMGDWC
jgi:hypothetical protein